MDIMPCSQCAATDTLKITDSLSIRSRDVDEDKLIDIIDIANEIDLEDTHVDVDPSDNISSLINSQTVEILMNISPPPLTNRSKASQSSPFLFSESPGPPSPPPPTIDTNYLCFSAHVSPKNTLSGFKFSPRASREYRAFSLNDTKSFKSTTSVHLPYIISETHSDVSTPIYDEETTLTDSQTSTMRARNKPNVYSPIANELWNEEDIDDLHCEMSQ